MRTITLIIRRENKACLRRLLEGKARLQLLLHCIHGGEAVSRVVRPQALPRAACLRILTLVLADTSDPAQMTPYLGVLPRPPF